MVKSNVRAMAKPRRKAASIDPELLKEIEQLKRAIREDDRKTAEVLARVDETRRLLREAASASARR